MPRSSLHVLLWSGERNVYELFTHDHLDQRFLAGDEHLWFAWLETATSFSFQGGSGRLNVYKETRRRGSAYWYAYYTAAHRTYKHYLGQASNLMFSRLEEIAKTLSDKATLVTHPLRPSQSVSEHQSLVLLTRLSPPHLPPLLIERAHLLTYLDTARFHRLTLISASAGWGKTTLLSAWARHVAAGVAWLSLDEMDNDPRHFWGSIFAALRTCLPEIGEMAQPMLQSQQPPPLITIVSTLMNELNALTEPIMLLLDDYHFIDEQAVHDSLLFLLEHLPTHLHLVIASRIDPPLALSRLRVRGHLLELRAADLRFQEDEAASFLAHTLGRPLESNDVIHLVRRTEGWIAGLQLSALSMKNQKDLSAFVRTFTGEHHYLLDYVQEEILAGLPTALQDFLLQISLLKRLSASLCQAVTAEIRSQELLETIERANLFLVPLDQERRWYRMHDLFREALQRRLKATSLEKVPLLHRRAARWYEGEGEWREAISHALAGSDYEYAASLMEQGVEEFWLHGGGQTLYHWIMELPDREVAHHAFFVLTTALYVLNDSISTSTEQYERGRTCVEHLMRRVEVVLKRQGEDTMGTQDVGLLQQHLLLLRLWSEIIEKTTRTGHERQYLIDRFGQIEQQMLRLEREDETIWQMIPLSVTFTLHWLLLGEGASLIPLFQEASQRAKQSGNVFAAIKVMQWLTGCYLSACKLRLAHGECRAALELIARNEGFILLRGYFSYWQASVCYQWNQLEEAHHILSALIPNAQTWQQIDLQVIGSLLLLDVELAAGNASRAHQILQQTQNLLSHQGTQRHHLQFTLAQVAYWLATGELSQASDWAVQASFTQENWEHERSWELLQVVRVFLAQQHYQAALKLLEDFRTQLDQRENVKITISFLALYLVVLRQVGKREQAQSILLRLLALTEPEKQVRIYLDMGRPMQYALKTFLYNAHNKVEAASAIFRPFAAKLLAAFKQEDQRQMVRAVASPEAVQAQKTVLDQASPPALLEPLTTQEQRVLRLLAAGHTYQEMAQILIVSHNTIKTQVRSIYRKLGVSRRAEALVLVQQFSLL